MVPIFGSGIMVGVNHPHRFGDPNCSFRIGKLVIQTAHFRAQNNSHTVKFSVSEFKLLKCVKRQTYDLNLASNLTVCGETLPKSVSGTVLTNPKKGDTYC